MRKISTVLALSLAPLSAFAHPGEHHLSITGMVAHYVSQPDHLAMLLLVIVGGFALAAKLSRKD